MRLPTFSPRSSAIRAAEDRTAKRRGSNIMIFLPFNQGASNSAKGSAVVFPAPGGAWSTKRLLFRSFSLASGMTWVMGRIL